MPRQTASRRPQNILLAGTRWHSDLTAAIAREAASLDWSLDLGPSHRGDIPNDWRGDGVIATAGVGLADINGLQQRTGCPVVGICLDLDDINTPCVLVDNDSVGRLAARHFQDRGFRHFALYSDGHSEAQGLRSDAFATELRAQGYELNYLITRDTRGQLPSNWSTRQAELRITLQALPKPLAVFADLDFNAVEVISACHEAGFHVPDQVAVLGALDMPLFRETSTIPLSSVAVDFAAATNIACQLLSRMMSGESVPPETIYIPPTGIVTRRSTDTIAAEDPRVVRVIRYLYAHYHEPLGLDEVVRYASMSKTRVYAAFERDVGQAPMEVLTRIRLNVAKRMLRETDAKIHAIADECGFGLVANLYHHFKRQLGVTPTEYRRDQLTSGT